MVYSATHTETNKKVAVKIIDVTEAELRSLINEIAIMRDCKHPNIVDYVGSFRSKNQLWVVMEYMDGGCLTEILNDYPEVVMNEKQIATVCKEVCYL